MLAYPKAFWEPFNESNERWDELRDHRSWWFGDVNKYPPRMELLESLERVIARHPKTTFVSVHFGNNPEDIEWVDRATRQTPEYDDRRRGTYPQKDWPRRRGEIA